MANKFFMSLVLIFMLHHSKASDTIVSFVIFIDEKICLDVSNEKISVYDQSKNLIKTYNVEYAAGILKLPLNVIIDSKDTNRLIEVSFNYYNRYGYASYILPIKSNCFSYLNGWDKLGYNIYHIYNLRKWKYRRKFFTTHNDEYVIEYQNSLGFSVANRRRYSPLGRSSTSKR